MKKLLLKISAGILLSLFFGFFSPGQALAQALDCGETGLTLVESCECTGGSYSAYNNGAGAQVFCCGWVSGISCSATAPDEPSEPIDPFEEVTSATFDTLNPLKIGGSDSPDVTVFEESQHAATLSKPGGFINRALEFAFPLAGLILFLMITVGGFQMLTGAASKKSMDAGKQRVSAAIVGFILLFASYWIIQIVERILGVNILSA